MNKRQVGPVASDLGLLPNKVGLELSGPLERPKCLLGPSGGDELGSQTYKNGGQVGPVIDHSRVRLGECLPEVACPREALERFGRPAGLGQQRRNVELTSCQADLKLRGRRVGFDERVANRPRPLVSALASSTLPDLESNKPSALSLVARSA
jgi:hypothetical protein